MDSFGASCLSFRETLRRECVGWLGSLQDLLQEIDLIKQHPENIIRDKMSRDLIKQHLGSLQSSLEASDNIIRDTMSRDLIFKEGNDQDKDSVARLKDMCAALDKTRRSLEGLQRWLDQESSFEVLHNCEFDSNQNCVACSDLRKMENEIRTARVAWMNLLTDDRCKRLVLVTKQLRKVEYARRSRIIVSFFKPPRVISLRWSVVGLSAASAQLMLNYDRSRSLRRDMLSSCDRKCGRLPGERIGQLLAFISSPTPPIFVVATLTYGIVTLAFYCLHDDDKYQAWFLMCGILVAAVIGFLDAMDLQGIILSSMPWCITTSLIMSACVHCILRKYKRRKAAFDEEMQDEKDCASK